MKKLLLFLCTAALSISLIGCEPSTERVVISKYPDKLVYVAGYDKVLDITGGELTFYMSNGEVRIHPMQLFFSTRFHYSIDFDTPGLYIVEIINYNYYGDFFVIQVVEPEYIDNILNQQRQ